jgi:hypothetical protein
LLVGLSHTDAPRATKARSVTCREEQIFILGGNADIWKVKIDYFTEFKFFYGIAAY